MNVPLHFMGEDIAPGVKVGGGSVSRMMNDVEISCLPKHLPEYLEVDISELELDAMLNLSDIKLPKGVEIPELAQGPEHDQRIVSIHVIKAAPIEEERGRRSAEVGAGEEPAADAAGDESSDD